MSLNPRFFSQPVRYLRWAAIEKPAIFWSIVLGSMGPAMFVIAPPIRRAFGDEEPSKIPLTYPSMFFAAMEALCYHRRLTQLLQFLQVLEKS